MDDLLQRFDVLDEIEAPDVWADGSTRAPRSQIPAPRHRAVTIAVAVLIAVTGVHSVP